MSSENGASRNVFNGFELWTVTTNLAHLYSSLQVAENASSPLRKRVMKQKHETTKFTQIWRSPPQSPFLCHCYLNIREAL